MTLEDSDTSWHYSSGVPFETWQLLATSEKPAHEAEDQCTEAAAASSIVLHHALRAASASLSLRLAQSQSAKRGTPAITTSYSSAT